MSFRKAGYENETSAKRRANICRRAASRRNLRVGAGGGVRFPLRLPEAALLSLQPLQLIRQPPPMNLSPVSP